MAKNTIEFVGNAGDAIKATADLEVKVVELEAKLRKMGQAGKKGGGDTAKALETVKGVAGSLLPVMGVSGAIAMGVREIVSLTKQWQEHASGVAEKISLSARDLAAFTMMQEPGTGGKRARAVGALGAAHGVKPGAALDVQQRFQAKFQGDFAKGLKATHAVFDLAEQAGVPVEGARQAVSVGMALNLSADEAARAAYAAGKASQKNPAELAQMAGGGLPAYMGIGGGPITGYGVAAALSAVIEEPEKLGTYTRQVGMLLQQRTGKVGKTWKRLGFAKPGAHPVEQLQALWDAGIRSMGDLQVAGFNKKESFGLSVLLANWPESKKIMNQTREMASQPNLIAIDRAAAEADVPTLKLMRERERKVAEFDAEQMLGADAGPRLQSDIHRRNIGLKMEREGFGFLVPETGVASWWGILRHAVLTNPAATSGPGAMPSTAMRDAAANLNRASGNLDMREHSRPKATGPEG